MATDPRYQPITADEFLAMDFGSDRKFELSNGVIQMMTGGSITHGRVAGNIYHVLRSRLAGSRCEPFNSDVGVRVDGINVCYPDVSVSCDRDSSLDDDLLLALDDPRVVFEVLSPSTTTFDQGTKLVEYQQVASIDTIVFIDPVNRLTRTYQREGDGWKDSTFARPHDVVLPALGITLTELELFGRH